MRRCFLTGEQVYYAEERAKRPQNFKKVHISNTPRESCPFCVENEYMTPKRVFGTKDNSVRIIPNKYPFVSMSDSENFGIHDVVIDTAEHDERLSQFSYEHMFKLMHTLRYRCTELEKNEKIKYVQIFKNQGIDAGASQSHSHWQIAALSIIPEKFERMLNVLENYYKENNKCYFCNINAGDRIIEEDENFIVFAPYASKFSYEMNIMPKKHISNFKLFDDNQLFEFGSILKHCVMRLANLYEGLSYNICFFSSPKIDKVKDYTHFYAQVFPRIGHMAGFEFSTGCFINSISPEKAAQVLRNIKI